MFKDYDEFLRANSLDSPVGIYIVQHGRFIFVNSQFCKDTGYTERELLTMNSMQIVHPDDRAFVRENAILMLKRERHQPYEFRTISKDGSVCWIVESVSSVQYQGSRAALANYLDVTERRQLAETQTRLLRQEQELSQKLQNELTNRAEYSKALVHELKTPLTAIIATSDIFEDLIDDERLKPLAENIRRSASSLNQRIDELLDLARGEAGILKNEPRDIDIVTLTRDLIEDMRSMAAKEGHALALDIESDIPSVHADPNRVQQVLTNLVGNSIKFTHANGHIEVRLRRNGDNIEVAVKDNGPGIELSQQGKLFDPYRSRQDGNQRVPGLGIGLALSKKMVELNGGRLSFVSLPGKGTVFSFTLPVVPVKEKTASFNPGNGLLFGNRSI